jgi:hypothetical protein
MVDWNLVRTKIDLKFWLGIAISLFFMVLLFRKIDFRLLGNAFRSADYRFIFLAVCEEVIAMSPISLWTVLWKCVISW